MKKVITLEIKKLRKNNSKVRLLKKYQLDSSNTIVYADYEIS